MTVANNRALVAEIGRAKGVLAAIEQAGLSIDLPNALQSGAPLDGFAYRDSVASAYWVEYIARAADFYAEVSPDRITTMVEVGPGLGLSTLAHLALNPHLKTIVNIDIPTTLYLSTQYLKSEPSVDVLDYRDLKDEREITLPFEAKNGSRPTILQLPPWKTDDLRGNVDLFCNAFSFYEMEEAQVRAYADLIGRLETRFCSFNMAETGKVLAHGPQTAISTEFLSALLAPHGLYETKRLNGINEHFYPSDTRVAIVMSRDG